MEILNEIFTWKTSASGSKKAMTKLPMVAQRSLKDTLKGIYIVSSVVQSLSRSIPDERSLVCPGSLNAIQGAAATVCEAVDSVMASRELEDVQSLHRAFVAIRPPGHHCGEDTPCGFCFINNVAVGAAHGNSIF